MKKSTLKLLLVSGVMFAIGFYLFFETKIAPKMAFQKVLIESLAGSKGSYSIAVEDLKTGEKYFIDPDRKFGTGSLYKLWVMAVAAEQIQNGAISADETLTGDVKDLNEKFEIDPSFRELTEGTVNFTVDSALTQMITISHNYASLVLSERVGLLNVKLFLEKHGFDNSIIGSAGQNAPVSTASDIALFLEKLYRGEFANEEYTSKMIKLLKAQKINDKLPKYLPKETVIAHKTGELDFLSHDAGIVYTKSGDYIIVVLSESGYPPEAKERIAQISKAVYNYFLEKNKI